MSIVRYFLFLLVLLSPNIAHAVCSSPAGVAGDMGFNQTGSGNYEYCNNTSWISMDANAASGLPSPAGHWKLDETSGSSLTDSSSNSNNATWTDGGDGNVTGETITAKIGTGLTFDAVATKVDMASPATLDNIFNGGGTIAMWFRADGVGEGSYGRIFEKATGTGAANGYSLILMAAPTLQFWREFSGGDGTWGNISITYGKWYHIAIVYDDSSATNDPVIYLNGTVYVTSDNNSTGTANTDASSNLTIGNSNAGDRTFDGVIDDVRIYSSSLTATNIQELYDQSYSRKMVGHWKLDEASGTTAKDSSGYGNDGVLTNMDGATDWVDGKDGNGLDFDGSNDHIILPSVSILQPSSLISVSAWVKADSFILWGSPIAHTNGSWASGFGFFHNGTNTLSFFIENYSNNVASITFSDTLGWHHIMGTWDGTTIRIYVDGVEGTSDTYSGTITYDATTYIGAISNPNLYNWDGQIDDVRIYDYGLTAAEVAKVYLCSRAGVMGYNDTNNVIEWCGDDDKYHIAGTAGAGGAGCSATGTLIAGSAGAMQYNTTSNKMVFCDGANWVNIPN